MTKAHLPITSTFEAACPVVGCDKDPQGHESADQSDNLHTRKGDEWGMPIDVYPIMDTTSWPVWVLRVDIPSVEVYIEMARSFAAGLLIAAREADLLNQIADLETLLAIRGVMVPAND